MQIDFTLNNLRLYTRSAPTSGFPGATPASTPAPTDQERLQLQLTRQRVATLQDSLSEINDVLTSTRGRVLQTRAEVMSGAALGLNNTRTAARIESSEQVNATTTSFTPFGPDIDGTSTAEVTIEGVYNGENGDDTLRFWIRRGGTHGEDDLKIRVFDGAGKTIKNTTVRASHAQDKTYNIGNGLKLSLGAGELVTGEEFFVDVSASVGAAVDPDKAFNGVRNDQPNFDYGNSVVAGAFDVNGVEIAVYAYDTLNAVLDRINSSAAGVTAAFDAATEKVLVTHDQTGSQADIVFENDTSGFLTATKLAGATVTPGRDADIDTWLADVAPLAAISSGTFSVNGADIAIDTSLDTLKEIVARINAEAVGLTAQLIEDGQRISLLADEPGMEMQLDDGDTGFFTAVGIDPGAYAGLFDNAGMSPQRATRLADALAGVASAVNDLANDGRIPGAPDGLLSNLRSALQGAATAGGSQATDGSLTAAAFGLIFDPDSFTGAVRDAVTFDRSRLRRMAVASPDIVKSFLVGGQANGTGGLVGRMTGAVTTYLQAQAGGSGSVGGQVDVFA